MPAAIASYSGPSWNRSLYDHTCLTCPRKCFARSAAHAATVSQSVMLITCGEEVFRAAAIAVKTTTRTTTRTTTTTTTTTEDAFGSDPEEYLGRRYYRPSLSPPTFLGGKEAKKWVGNNAF